MSEFNVKKTPLKIARSYTQSKFSEHGVNIDSILPNFNHNYPLLQRLISKFAKNIPRNKMPVIEPKDMDEFERKLETGRIDIFKPYAIRKGYFPKKFKSKAEREQWLKLGKLDGNEYDDSIPVEILRIPAIRLKPLQSQIWLDILIESIIKYGKPNQASSAVNTTIIISQEHYILDGHHRWGQVILTDPNLLMKCLYVPFTIPTLLKMGRTYGTAIGNKPNI